MKGKTCSEIAFMSILLHHYDYPLYVGCPPSENEQTNPKGCDKHIYLISLWCTFI